MYPVYLLHRKSGGAPPHSKTQAKLPRPEWRPRFGVRQCSAAFERAIHYHLVIAIVAFGIRPSVMFMLHEWRTGRFEVEDFAKQIPDRVWKRGQKKRAVTRKIHTQATTDMRCYLV